MSVNVTLDHKVKDQVQIAAVASSARREKEDILFQPPEQKTVKAVITDGTKPKIRADQLATSWNIGLEMAKRTLQATTQVGLHNIFSPSERKVRLKAPWLKFPSVNTQIFSDDLFSKVPSIHKNVGAVVFTDRKGFDSFHPFKSKANCPKHLIVTDGESEMQKGRGQSIANECNINLKVTVPYSPWQSKAEATVRELKRFTRRKIQQTKAPRRLWLYAGKWGAAIRRLSALNIPELDGRTPYEHITGSTPNITLHCMFDWHQPDYFH